MDKLFAEAEHILSSVFPSTFLQEYVGDISPEVCEKILDRISSFRIELKALLKRHGLISSGKSAAKAILACLLFADMALEQIDSRHMDHGKLAESAALELDLIVSRLRHSVRELRDCL